MLVATLPNYQRLCRASYLLYALALVLLVLVFFTRPINGSHRWIRLGPLSLQPSEFAKVAFVLALARYLMYRDNFRRLSGLWMPLGVALVPMVLVLREPDLGTALVFVPVLFLMLYAAGTRTSHLLIVAVAGIALTPALWSQMSREQKSRITALFEQAGPGEKPTPDGYHLHQAKRLMALGGWTGSYFSGDAVDDLEAFRVPEAHTDSVFSVVAERLGLLGAMSLLALYFLLVWRGLAIADQTREPFGRLVAVGLTSLIAVQALINTGMMIGLLPITGLALPLASYGGSSLLANSLALGILINVAIRPGYEVAATPFRFSDAA